MNVQENSSRAARAGELARVFTRLGFTAFGGPAAHIALMEDEIVTRRRWIDRAHFLDLVAAVNFIPGPNSTELAIHIGQLRAGFLGLIVAGACFIIPAVLITLPLAWTYVTYGDLPRAGPILSSVSAAVVAIVVIATWRFARTGLKDRFGVVLMMLVAIAAPLSQRYAAMQPEIPALVIAAVAGAVYYAPRRRSPAITVLVLTPEMLRLVLFFLKVGATLFGSGYVLISYLQSGLVQDYRWLTQRQLLDAIAVGQFTPGPLLTTATFIGFVVGHSTFAGGNTGGLIGALVATVAIFLPAFVLIAILGPVLQRLRRSALARAALDGMNAAVVGLMIVAAAQLAGAALLREAFWPDWGNVLIFAASLALLWRRINATWIVVGAAIVGVLFSF